MWSSDETVALHSGMLMQTETRGGGGLGGTPAQELEAPGAHRDDGAEEQIPSDPIRSHQI